MADGEDVDGVSVFVSSACPLRILAMMSMGSKVGEKGGKCGTIFLLSS